MEINVTIGKFQLTITSSSSSQCSLSTTPPKIHTTDNGSEQTIDLFHFTGTIKVKSADGKTSVKAKLGTSGGRKNEEQKKRLSRIHRTVADISSQYGIDPSDSMTTPLHICCASRTPRISEMETILNSNPKVVFIPDKSGNLPIHLLSCNENIFKNKQCFDQVDAFANKLLQAYPESVIMKNNIGYIPFVHCINRWIDSELSNTNEGTIITPQLIMGLHDFYTVFQTSLEITPMAEWCILTLSSIMEQSDDQIFYEIAQNVSSVNLLIKTILLIDNVNTRHKIMNTTLFKRVILEQRTAGLWIIPMLRAGEVFSSRCIDYFQMLSNSTVANYIGRKRMAEPSDIEMFQQSRNEVYKRIGKSKYFIPSLCLLSIDEKKRAAKTNVIREITENAVNDRFVFSIFRNDIFQLISLLISFRTLTFGTGVVITIPAGDLKHDLFELFLFDIYICLAICTYLMMRKISQCLSLMSISLQICLKTIVNTWYIQLSTITLTLISVAMIKHEGKNNPIVLSITSGSMWVSLLYLVQRLVKPMHHFTISWKMILGSIYWYWIILAVVILMFGDMMHIYTTNTGRLCNLAVTPHNDESMGSNPMESRRLAGENFFGDVVMTPYTESNEITSTDEIFENYNRTHPFCTSDLKMGYGVVSGILIGGFNLRLFLEEDDFTYYLFIFFSFCVAIFLITLLITLVNEYYAKLKDKAEEDLGRKRIDFAAEQVILKNSITSTFDELTRMQKAAFIYHWVVLASTFVLYGVMCYLYYKKLSNNKDTDYVSIWGNENIHICVILAQIIVPGINQILLLDSIISYYAVDNARLMDIRNFFTAPVRIIFPHVAHLTQKIGIVLVLDQNDETGQLLSFERSIKEVVERSEKRILESCEKTEQHILSNGEEIKYCLVDLMDTMPKRKEDDDSSCSSDSSSHITFTRKDFGLSYPT